MQTASMILALGVGLVASEPDREPMRTIVEPSAAGMLARRALPVIIVLALSLGWMRVSIQQHGLVDTAFGTALRTLIEIVLLSGLLWWAVAMVRAHERALYDSEAEVRRQAGQLAAFLETAAIDIGMPKANGYEVARRIRAHGSGKQVYLVALTGWGQEGDKRRAEEAGFDAHLVKPIALETLDRLLATIGGFAMVRDEGATDHG